MTLKYFDKRYSKDPESKSVLHDVLSVESNEKYWIVSFTYETSDTKLPINECCNLTLE
jgi:hypothetical protein